MVQTVDPVEVATLPLAPRSPLPYLQRVNATRNYHHGFEKLRDAGGPVTRYKLAPTRIIPEIVITTSPQGIHDVLDRPNTFIEKDLPVFDEQQRLVGGNLFNLRHSEWLPRRRALQRVFTKNRVAGYSQHMAEAAEYSFDHCDEAEVTDLDALCHSLTLRALGHSVLGLGLDDHTDELADALHKTLEYPITRASRAVRAPQWAPTPARHRARVAAAKLHALAAKILQECRSDPSREAPLVRALIDATDPETGASLSDKQICDELILFMVAGHDTTSTTLTYSLWALGRHPELQDRVADEVAQLGNRRLTPDDLPHLPYTVQVLHEALRLCPPAPALSRQAVTDVDVDGYRVEAGTWLAVGIYAMHRDPSLWKDPMTFDPDRFAPENFDDHDRWQYLPFGGGPRGCIGSHFAMLEATLALATIIGQHRIEALDDEFPVDLPFTMIPKGPIRARVSDRNGRP